MTSWTRWCSPKTSTLQIETCVSDMMVSTIQNGDNYGETPPEYQQGVQTRHKWLLWFRWLEGAYKPTSFQCWYWWNTMSATNLSSLLSDKNFIRETRQSTTAVIFIKQNRNIEDANNRRHDSLNLPQYDCRRRMGPAGISRGRTPWNPLQEQCLQS